MNKINRFKFLSAVLALAYVLSACSGVPAGVGTQSQAAQQPGNEPQQVVFTGTVQSMGGQWNVSGQPISVDGSTQVDANVAVGSNVRVEAVVDSQGGVKARSIELAVPEVTNANSNTNTNTNDNSSNTNDVNANTNTNANDNSANSNSNANTNTNANDNGNNNSAVSAEQEIVGTVTSVQNGSIIINGVTYSIADFTEFKNTIAAGDQVKMQVIMNADGTFTIREIETVTQTSVDNSNSNGSDDNTNLNSNTNGDDHGGSNSNSNDDHSNDNNDDQSNDNGGNSNGGG